MKVLFVAVLLTLPLLGFAAAQEVSDPARTILILGDFETPQLAPGDEGPLTFDITNPYTWAMNATSLLVEIYAFSTSSRTIPVGELASAPILRFPVAQGLEDGVRGVLDLGSLDPGSSSRIELTVVTELDTPRGSVFSQGSYQVRFRLEFDYPQGQHAVMVSPGFYDGEELAYALRDATPEEMATYRYVGFANYTYLGERLGLDSIDGILPDTTFGVKDPLSLWPFYAILGGSVAAFGLYVYYYRRERGGDSKP